MPRLYSSLPFPLLWSSIWCHFVRIFNAKFVRVPPKALQSWQYKQQQQLSGESIWFATSAELNSTLFAIQDSKPIILCRSGSDCSLVENFTLLPELCACNSTDAFLSQTGQAYRLEALLQRVTIRSGTQRRKTERKREQISGTKRNWLSPTSCRPPESYCLGWAAERLNERFMVVLVQFKGRNASEWVGWILVHRPNWILSRTVRVVSRELFR